MFQLISGASIPDTSALHEGYTAQTNRLIANVSAEHILPVFDSFLSQARDTEQLFLFLEVPCRKDEELSLNCIDIRQPDRLRTLHRNVWYLDGITKVPLQQMLHSDAGEVLIHDGLTCFGIGSLETHDEIGKYKYNIMQAFAYEKKPMELASVFDRLGILYCLSLTTAWDVFSDENPGSSTTFEYRGRTVYDLIEDLQELGLYKAETREEN